MEHRISSTELVRRLGDILGRVRYLGADTPALAAARRAKSDALAARVPVIPFGSATAERWADPFAALQCADTPVPANDLMVAATALELDFDVLVGPADDAHFRVSEACGWNGSPETEVGALLQRGEW